MRFAVCVCGDMRGFARLAWSLEQRLLRPTTAKVDLYFHVWSDGSVLETGGVAAARKLPGVVSVVVEPTALRDNLTAASYGWSPGRTVGGSGSFESFRSQVCPFLPASLAFGATASGTRLTFAVGVCLGSGARCTCALPMHLLMLVLLHLTAATTMHTCARALIPCT